VTPDGKARQVADKLAFPNGMIVTPDDSTLIVSESFAGRFMAFDIAPDGWRGFEKLDETLAARTGQVLTVRAPAPRAGWP
jgi:sugar lactone lactonase YvrE